MLNFICSAVEPTTFWGTLIEWIGLRGNISLTVSFWHQEYFEHDSWLIVNDSLNMVGLRSLA